MFPPAAPVQSHKRRRSLTDESLVPNMKRLRLDPDTYDPVSSLLFVIMDEREMEASDDDETRDLWTHQCSNLKQSLIDGMNNYCSLNSWDVSKITAQKVEESDSTVLHIVASLGPKPIIRVDLPKRLFEAASKAMNDNLNESRVCCYSETMVDEVEQAKEEIAAAVPKIGFLVKHAPKLSQRRRALDVLTSLMRRCLSTKLCPYIDPALREFLTSFTIEDMNEVTRDMAENEKSLFESRQWEVIFDIEMMEQLWADTRVQNVVVSDGFDDCPVRMTTHGAEEDEDEDGDCEMKCAMDDGVEDQKLFDAMQAMDSMDDIGVDALATLMGSLRVDEIRQDLSFTDRQVIDVEEKEQEQQKPMNHDDDDCPFRKKMAGTGEDMEGFPPQGCPRDFEGTYRFFNQTMEEKMNHDLYNLFRLDHLTTPKGHECLKNIFLKKGWTPKLIAYLMIKDMRDNWTSSGFFGLVESFIITRSKQELRYIIFFLENDGDLTKYFERDGIRLFQILLKRSRKEHCRFQELIKLLMPYLARARRGDRICLLAPLLITLFHDHEKVKQFLNGFFPQRILMELPDDTVQELCDAIDETKSHARQFYKEFLRDYPTFSSHQGRIIINHLLHKRPPTRPSFIIQFSKQWEHRMLHDSNGREVVMMLLRSRKWKDVTALTDLFVQMTKWMHCSKDVRKVSLEKSDNGNEFVAFGRGVIDVFEEKMPRVVASVRGLRKKELGKKVRKYLEELKKWRAGVELARRKSGFE